MRAERLARTRRRALLVPGFGVSLLAILALAVVGVADTVPTGAGHPLGAVLNPEPAAATATLGLAGAAEGTAIAMVIVVVVLAVQLTADRYSPRVIDIFLRDPMNLGVLGLFLGSIILTIGVSAEVRRDSVPVAGYLTALILAAADFGILFAYIRRIFTAMRGEAIIEAVTARTVRGLSGLGSEQHRHTVAHRQQLRSYVAQIGDIALGSIQRGDAEACVAAVESLGSLIVTNYLPLKGRLDPHWFATRPGDLPGASEEVVAEVGRARCWVEYAILSRFLDLLGETPAFRKEVIRAVAAATGHIGSAAVRDGDMELLDLVIRFLNTYLRAAATQRAPFFAYSIMDEYRQLVQDAVRVRPELEVSAAERLLFYGRLFDEEGMPFVRVIAAEDVGTMVLNAVDRGSEHAERLVSELATAVSEAAIEERAIASVGLVTVGLKLAVRLSTRRREDVADRLTAALSYAPPAALDEAVGRLRQPPGRLFWEISERTISFDWMADDEAALVMATLERVQAVAATASQEPPAPTSPRACSGRRRSG